jgi:hypothetical protein
MELLDELELESMELLDELESIELLDELEELELPYSYSFHLAGSLKT